MCRSQAYLAIEAAYRSGGVPAAIHAFLSQFPDRSQDQALVFMRRQGWIEE